MNSLKHDNTLHHHLELSIEAMLSGLSQILNLSTEWRSRNWAQATFDESVEMVASVSVWLFSSAFFTQWIFSLFQTVHFKPLIWFCGGNPSRSAVTDQLQTSYRPLVWVFRFDTIKHGTFSHLSLPFWHLIWTLAGHLDKSLHAGSCCCVIGSLDICFIQHLNRYT